MKVQSVDENALLTAFSSTKRRILIILKQKESIELSTLSKELGISKMGTLNHIKDLEELEIIERFHIRAGVGRPRLAIKLAKMSADIFPKAYSSLTCSMLEFIEDNMGRNAVYDALKKRQQEVFILYKPHLTGSFDDKISELKKIRDKEGYMVELNMLPGKQSYELLEYNCPILAVAEQFEESCRVEAELFEDLLGADVSTSHRTVAGDHVCRFVIKQKK